MKTSDLGIVEEQTNKTRRTFLDDMDALACGVEARFEESTGYSRRVAETTADIARELGIPEDEIEKWASFRLTRLAHDTEKLREIKSRLERVRGSFVEQVDDKDTTKNDKK